MKRLRLAVQCMAVYEGGIDVPDDMSVEEAIEYAKDHLDEVPVGELEYISDSDVLDEENCKFEDMIQEDHPFGYQAADSGFSQYPYDFRNGYKIQTVYADKTAEGIYGDVYDFRADVEREHPGAEVLIGYCVIDEALGLVPDGCNDWNDTIPDAIQDYEDHVVPLLEREEHIELNSTELDEQGDPIRETLFSVKSGWLQDYLGVDDQCQLEALLTNSKEWDPTEILEDARKEPEISGLSVGEITEFKCGPEQKEVAVPLGHSIFLDWANIDAVLDRWAKSYFGDHVTARGSREETDFEIEIEHLKARDCVKYARLFEMYDTEHDYDPDMEFEVSPHTSILPVSITRGVMQDALPDQGLAAYGCSVAVYDGVFFMEHSKEQRVISAPQAALEFIFDEEIMISDDFLKLEGYVWAMSSLVNRLKAQVPPLEEDQFMENINFYPIYDVGNGAITMEGHYYLEDAHYARGRAFTLPLTPDESARLVTAFESYCRKREGMTCLEFLNRIREQAGVNRLVPRSLDDQIEAASNRTVGAQSNDMNEKKKTHEI